MSEKCVDDFRLKLIGKEYVPIMLGGMGVDISTRELAVEVARLGGIGHISDALITAVSDKLFKTSFVKDKLAKHKSTVDSVDKTGVVFDLDAIAESQKNHVKAAMDAKQGNGGVFINCMEKLTMAQPADTLKARLNAALDAGIDGITMSAGLHLGSMAMMKDNPRFREAALGIIVSSVRALKLFLKRAKKVDRMPDFVVVEGPLAGGHLGFGVDNWHEFDLKTITQEVLDYLKDEGLDIAVIPAGGIFTGGDAVKFLEMGCAAVQVANRFTVTKECGLPDEAKQAYFSAETDNIIVNTISPTGYPMRMLTDSPAIGGGIKPNCEAYGYLLDKGKCSYIEAWHGAADALKEGEKISVADKTCLCAQMRKHKVWTCGSTTDRLKDTTKKLEDGAYQILSAEHVFKDYQFSKGDHIELPQ